MTDDPKSTAADALRKALAVKKAAAKGGAGGGFKPAQHAGDDGAHHLIGIGMVRVVDACDDAVGLRVVVVLRHRRPRPVNLARRSATRSCRP